MLYGTVCLLVLRVEPNTILALQWRQLSVVSMLGIFWLYDRTQLYNTSIAGVHLSASYLVNITLLVHKTTTCSSKSYWIDVLL